MVDKDEQSEGAETGPAPRQGRVNLTLRISPELHRTLRVKAFSEDRTIQDIILEALRRMGIEG